MENNNIDFSWLENMSTVELSKTIKLLMSFKDNPDIIKTYIDKALDLIKNTAIEPVKEPVKESINDIEDRWHHYGDINFLDNGLEVKQLDDQHYAVLTCFPLENDNYKLKYGVVNTSIFDDDFITKIAELAHEKVDTYKNNEMLLVADLVSYVGLSEFDPYYVSRYDLTLNELIQTLKDWNIPIDRIDTEQKIIEIG